MKKMRWMSVLVMVAIVLCACGSSKKKEEYSVKTANPFEECATLTEAEAKSGIAVVGLPIVEGYDQYIYRASEGEMLEVIMNDKDGNEGLRFRKANGTDDISGDYNEYAQTGTVLYDDFTVNVRGADGKAKVITWVETVEGKSYTYAIDVAAAEITNDKVTTLVSQTSDILNIIATAPVEETPDDTVDGSAIVPDSILTGHVFKVVDKTMYVKADLLNAREYPMDIDPTAEVVTQLDNGTVVQVKYQSEEWSGFEYTVDGVTKVVWAKTEFLSEQS